MTVTFREAIDGLDEASFQAIYGAWHPLPPEELAGLLAAGGIRWRIGGGRAARAGAQPRQHSDTDVVIRAADFEAVRAVMAGWQLWEVDDGALKPLLPGVALTPDCEELWVRRAADQPWRFELLLDRASTDDEWVYKRDARVRLPWDRAVHAVGGIEYLRPEVALLFKAKHDRPKDRADLLAARLDPAARDWLAGTLDLVGHRNWAGLTRAGGAGDFGGEGTGADAGGTGAIDQDWR